MPAAERYKLIGWSMLALALPWSAHAQASQGLELSWSAPPGCPNGAQVLRKIRDLAGALPEAALQLRAEAKIERGSNGLFHLQLVTHAGGLTGDRAVEGKSCVDLANTAAIHLALLLRAAEAAPDGGSPPTAAPAAASAPPAPAAADGSSRSTPEASPDAAPSEEPATPRSLFGLLQLPLMAASIGPLPALSPGLSVAAGLQIERVRVFLEAQAWLAQQLLASQEPSLGADLTRMSANVRGCHAFGAGAWELAPCVLIGAAHLRAQGRGSHLAARAGEITWLTAGVGAQLRLALTPWLGVVLRADAQWGLARPRIVVSGIGNIGQLGPAALGLALGTEWIL